MRIKRNGTLGQLLREAGVMDAAPWLQALARVADLRKIRREDRVCLYTTEGGELARLTLDRNAWERAVVTPAAPPKLVPPLMADVLPAPLLQAPTLDAALEQDATTLAPELVEIEVSSSLYQALVDAGWDAQLAFELADVFAWDLDFYSDVQKGDRALAWVDVRRRQGGELIGYGKLHGALYVGRVGSFSAFRFRPEGGTESYYDESGRALRKEFLKSPLKYAHVTSRFGNRKHPVLGYTRQHAGVDFQAAIGTPVWAVGDGKVTSAGWQGGYGKCVTLRHPSGLESLYAHLSRIDVRAGQHVAQKTVIGHSGNTGLSSGPHLHFGLRRGGAFMNPLAWKPVRTEPLREDELPAFHAAIAQVQKRLSEAQGAKRHSAR